MPLRTGSLPSCLSSHRIAACCLALCCLTSLPAVAAPRPDDPPAAPETVITGGAGPAAAGEAAGASDAAEAVDTAPRSPKVGEFPPPLLGKDRDGNPVDLSALRGRPAIVTFWASWCGPCRRELPVLGHFQRTVGTDALTVVAVNFKEPRNEFRSVVRANRDIAVTWVHDAEGEVSALYGINSVPHMFMIGIDGRIAKIHRGYSEKALPGIVDDLIALLPEEVRNRPAQRPEAKARR